MKPKYPDDSDLGITLICPENLDVSISGNCKNTRNTGAFAFEEFSGRFLGRLGKTDPIGSEERCTQKNVTWRFLEAKMPNLETIDFQVNYVTYFT